MRRPARGRVLFRNPFRRALANAIKSPDADIGRVWRAYRSLPSEDRDCLPWVPRLLAMES